MTEPYYADEQVTLLLGDTLEVLRAMPDASVDCCVTSPPYFQLRDYETPGQYGLEPTVAEYVETMRQVFAEVRRVLAADGTLWLNLGDSYAGARSGPPGKTSALIAHGSARTAAAHSVAAKTAPVPNKNLLGVPWRVAFALQDEGWILRNAIVWEKANPMPESVRDRLSTVYEHVFLLVKSARNHFDLDAIRIPAQTKSVAYARTWDERKAAGEPTRYGLAGISSSDLGAHPNGRNPGDVWRIATRRYAEAHFAVMAPELAKRCITAGCKPDGIVLDPFSGSGTTGEAARMLGRKYVGIDLNPAYHDLAVKRFAQGVLDFETEGAA